ncbi:hypothetical protein OSB04_010087 [Centaurea solstitialis]|uniref:Cystatin domain-containing protein n=1 Tax=Centaurea solstitialis TaxID=347529 RepID=A0AA38TRQ1_9ASTR|nr:hypothetical protein OSB04_010087 [Centaurea solstitialis]
MARKLTISTFSILILSILLSNCLVNAIPGGRKKINDVNTDKDVQELGKYSVDEYNRLQRSRKGSAGDDLKFSKVVAAETQVVSGIKYYLKVEAVSKSGVSKVFDAEVVVKPWMKSKQLLNFKPSSPGRN